MRNLITLLFLLVAVFISACSGSTPAPTNVYTTLSEGSLKAGDVIPQPTGDAVITVTGKIGAANMPDGSIQMDMQTIESLGLVEYKVNDPFESVDATYQGVLLSELLALWQVPDDATELDMTALNDYVVTIPVSDAKDWPVIFAVKRDGDYMPVSTRGPAMLVYPYDHFQFDREMFDDRWIWQIKSVTVK